MTEEECKEILYDYYLYGTGKGSPKGFFNWNKSKTEYRLISDEVVGFGEFESKQLIKIKKDK